MQLRPYQSMAVDALYNYFRTNTGNPLIVAPTASGKSVMIAGFIERACKQFPNTRAMILTHVKELIQQDYDKIKTVWPEAPVGINSAGLRQRHTLFPIIVAGIQSVYKNANHFGYQSFLMIDEAHLLNPNEASMYQRFIADMLKINPKLKIIGWTATPYRMKGGLLTIGKDRIFTDIAYEITLDYLLGDNPEGIQYISYLKGKKTDTEIDLEGLKTVAGDYHRGQLEERFDDEALMERVLDEVMQLSENRRSWLLFCSGVDHALHVRDALRKRGITCEAVTQKTSNEERDKILADFKQGNIRAVTNYGVLTTGFDAPCTDNIILLRATKSCGLYVQMLGRGMRLNGKTFEESVRNGKEDCQVLDYGKNLQRFGPINCIDIRTKEDPDPKTCPKCHETNSGRAKKCVECGYAFEPLPSKTCPECEAEVFIFVRVCNAIERQCNSCGESFHARGHKSEVICPDCGMDDYTTMQHQCTYEFPLEEGKPNLTHQAADGEFIAQLNEPENVNITHVTYSRHTKPGKPDSLRVTYHASLTSQYQEWVTLEHTGPARMRAFTWWKIRTGPESKAPMTVTEALQRIKELREPSIIQVTKEGKYFTVTGVVQWASKPSEIDTPRFTANAW